MCALTIDQVSGGHSIVHDGSSWFGSDCGERGFIGGVRATSVINVVRTICGRILETDVLQTDGSLNQNTHAYHASLGDLFVGSILIPSLHD